MESTGEPFIFGFDPKELREYLAARGFTLTGDQSTAQASALYNRSLRRREAGSSLYRVAVTERGMPRRSLFF